MHRTDKELKSLWRTTYIENNRILRAGMDRLMDLHQHEYKDFICPARDAGSSASDGNTPIKEQKSGFIEWAIKRCNLQNGTVSEARAQNHLSQFFEFFLTEEKRWEHDFNTSGISKKDLLIRDIEAIFECYRQLQQISSNSQPTYGLANMFEDFCNKARVAMSSQYACIYCIREENPLPLAQSSIRLNFINELNVDRDKTAYTRNFQAAQPGLAEVRDIYARISFRAHLDEPRQDISEGEPHCAIDSLADTAYKLKREGGVVIAFLFEMPPPEIAMESSGQIMMLFGYENSKSEHFLPLELYRIRNLLFMRSQIARALAKHIHLLIASSTQYSYVEPFSEVPSVFPWDGYAQPKKVHILHISDVHLQEKNSEDLFSIAKNIVFMDSTRKNELTFDLLVITGDIIQGNVSAGALERNYTLAAEFVRRLAVRLWANGDMLRSDWRKRVIIIPGNHDYASMNEIEVIPRHGNRQTGIGRPSQREGGPFAKFAYYMYFLNGLLGTDIGALIENGMNDLRTYRQLGLRILALNSVSAAGPLRNNKVLIDQNFVQRQASIPDSHNFPTICLSHHAPNYNIDYIMDRYNPRELKTDAKRSLDDFTTAVNKIYGNEPDYVAAGCLLDRLLIRCASNKMDPEKSQFYSDVIYMREHLAELYNERCMQIYNAIQRDTRMSEIDRKELKELFGQIQDTVKPKIYLSGHIHQEKRDETEQTYCADLFFRKEDKTLKASYGYAILDNHSKIIRWDSSFFTM